MIPDDQYFLIIIPKHLPIFLIAKQLSCTPISELGSESLSSVTERSQTEMGREKGRGGKGGGGDKQLP
jgi:hypothetical protein